MNPYYLMTLLYLALAVLGALDTSLVNLSILASFPGQRWLLVHTVTLGGLVELLFGLAPDVTAALAKLPRPKFHWATWVLLNGGLILLYAGIPLINASLITTGGTLIFIAALLLIWKLMELTRQRTGMDQAAGKEPAGRAPGLKFYISALTFLLIGILVGTGLWLGWAEPLRIVTPKEVHVHSNLWGFASIAIAGILFDLYPAFSGLKPAKPWSINLTFWLMTLGALGMVIGPWIDDNNFTVYGLVTHTLGTIVMLIILFKPLFGKSRERAGGFWYLIFAYIWFLVAVVVAPLVVAGGGFGAEVAGSGGPILIFGWILQIGYAIFPYLFARVFLPDQPARMDVNWLSLATSNGGSLIYWVSMFLAGGRSPMRGLAYLLWIISLIPILVNLMSTISRRLEQIRNQDGAFSE
jgi:hypothetical protein